MGWGGLEKTAAGIRAVIGGFEVCYHEADVEARRIITAIGKMALAGESKERPPARKQELGNARDILSGWCDGDILAVKGSGVGGMPGEQGVKSE